MEKSNEEVEIKNRKQAVAQNPLNNVQNNKETGFKGDWPHPTPAPINMRAPSNFEPPKKPRKDGKPPQFWE